METDLMKRMNAGEKNAIIQGLNSTSRNERAIAIIDSTRMNYGIPSMTGQDIMRTLINKHTSLMGERSFR